MMTYCIVGGSCFILGLILGGISTPRCPHDWQLVDKVEFKPLIEDITANGYGPTPGEGRASVDWFRRKIHLAIKCVKCGELEMKKLES